MGVVTERRDVDLSKGIAIGSILQTDEHSHLEPVRYPAGSGFFRPLAMPHAPGDTVGTRLLNAGAMFAEEARGPRSRRRSCPTGRSTR